MPWLGVSAGAVVIALCAALISACAGVVVAGGAGAVSAATQECGSTGTISDTAGKIVYRMGNARNAGALARLEAHAREVSYVKRVVSYVVLNNDLKRKAPRHRGRSRGWT